MRRPPPLPEPPPRSARRPAAEPEPAPWVDALRGEPVPAPTDDTRAADAPMGRGDDRNAGDGGDEHRAYEHRADDARPEEQRPGDPAAGDPDDAAPTWRDVTRATWARRRALRREERRFTARARRRRRFWLLGAGALVVVVVGTVGAAYSPLFAVQEISVVGASDDLSASVEDALHEQRGVPLALVSDSAVKDVLVTFPRVESYTLEARPPSELVVRLVERTPVGVIEGDAGFSTVDAAGVVLATTPEPPEGLPRLDAQGGLDGAPFTALARVLRALPDDIRGRVTEGSATTRDDVTLVLGDTGTTVVWGSVDDTAEKAVILEQIMRSVPPEEVSRYDVSSPGAVVVN